MIELLQFRHSPYNEKVRWALDLKRVPHRRRSLLPGPHLRVVRALTGRSHTPVLVSDGVALDGSARILEWLEQRYPDPPLFPESAQDRAEAMRIQAWFDDDLTPRIRRAVLDALLRNPRDFARVFGDGRSAWAQAGYACIVPLAAPLVRRGNGITGADAVADGLRAAGEALDFVVQRGGDAGTLAGPRFGIADITAASTLATVVRPAKSPMHVPGRFGSPMTAVIERFREHPGARWVRAMYERHRGATTDFDGPSEART
jgi:glutathione S-transferase